MRRSILGGRREQMPGACTREAADTRRRPHRPSRTHHSTSCLMRRKELDRRKRFRDDALAVAKLDLLAPRELLRWALQRNPIFSPRLFRTCKAYLGYFNFPSQPTHPYFSRAPCHLPGTPLPLSSQWIFFLNPPRVPALVQNPASKLVKGNRLTAAAPFSGFQ